MPSTTLVVLSGKLILPPGVYIVLINLGSVNSAKLKEIVLRDSDSSFIGCTRSSNSMTVVTDLSNRTSDTEIKVYVEPTESINVEADRRFNYLAAVRIK